MSRGSVIRQEDLDRYTAVEKQYIEMKISLSQNNLIKISDLVRVDTVDDLPVTAKVGDIMLVGEENSDEHTEYWFTPFGNWEPMGASETEIYNHPTEPGYFHVPAGGAEGDILTFDSDGKAKWDDMPIKPRAKKNDYALIQSTEDGSTYKKVPLSELGVTTTVPIVTPTLIGTYMYDGTEQEPEFDGYDPEALEMTGDITATNAGDYTVAFTPRDGYMWEDDESSDTIYVDWTMERKSIPVVSKTADPTYTGSEQNPTVSNYNTAVMDVTGTYNATDAGNYSATFTPKSNYKWSNGSIDPITINWTMNRKKIANVPAQSGTLTYTGVEQTPTFSNYSTSELSIAGDTAKTDAGDYTAKFTPKSNYCWNDGTYGEVSVGWSIGKKPISTVPSQKATLTYNGSAQTPEWNNYNASELTISITEQTNANTYSATFTPKNNYKWSDNSTSKSANWTIEKKPISTVPSQKGTLTYTGSEQTPEWNNYNTDELDITIAAQTNANMYSATFTPKSNYKWSDGATSKSADWTIGKATCSITLSPTSLTLDSSNLSKPVTVTRSGDGSITATSSNTAVATVTYSDTTVTVNGVKSGSATITVNVAEGTNHLAGSKTFTATVSLPSTILSENTPAQIASVGQSGQGANYFAVGNKIAISINGTVGSLAINDTYYAVIIGIQHNSEVEGNGIHFAIGQDSSGKDIAFCDGHDFYSDGGRMVMNTSDTKSGGWNDSYMRNTICPAFLAAMPTEWQNAISACTKYTDNVGNNSDTASNVTATSDKIWLMAGFEVIGGRGFANSAEQNYQKQYDYYKNGNSKARYDHSANTTEVAWWSRSAYFARLNYFCYVLTDGSARALNASRSLGFVPCFRM